MKKVKGFKFGIENPTLKQRTVTLVFNFLLWWSYKLYKHDDQKMTAEIKELTMMYLELIK